jgi:hypothetical protein
MNNDTITRYNVKETFAPWRWLGNFISYLLHPLFIPVYVAAFLLWWHPFAFTGTPFREKLRILLSVIVNTALFPAVVVALLKQLGFIESIRLHTQKDRVIPVIASMTFYFWAFYVSKNIAGISPLLTHFLLGTFLGSIATLLLNIRMKVSLHAVAAGALALFLLIHSLHAERSMGFFLIIGFFLSALMLTARLWSSNHSQKEIYWGWIAGACCMILAFYFTKF